MNSYLSIKELNEIGFNSLGKNVKISKLCRIYNPQRITIGNNVRIDDFTILSGKIKIGNFIHIAAYTSFFGGELGIILNDFSNISSRVAIYAVSDDYSGQSLTNPLIPEKYKKVNHSKVTIGKHVIIGSGCTVLPGVDLKEGSAFGAMTLINKDSEPWSINAGIPFKKIKNRSRKLLDLERKFMEVYNGE